MKALLSFELQYEPSQAGLPRGPMAGFAAEAARLAQTVPLAIPFSACGQASKVLSGVLLPAKARSGPPALRLKSISRAGSAVVLRSYDQWGRLTSVHYPDQTAVSYSFGEAEQPDRIAVGAKTKMEKRWDELGNLVEFRLSPGPGRLVLHRGGDGAVQRLASDRDDLSFLREHGESISVGVADGAQLQFATEPRVGEAILRARLGGVSREFPLADGISRTAAVACPSSGTYTFSPLGIMRSNDQGRVVFWLRPDGNPMWFVHDASGRVSQVWTAQGVTLIEHGDGGLFVFVTSAGDRHLLVPMDKGPLVLVGPETVSLVQCDSARRIQSLQGLWGDSVQFRYGLLGRSAFPRGVASSQAGKLTIAYTKDNRLRQVAVAQQGRVEFQYSESRSWEGIRIAGQSLDGLLRAIHAAGLLYCLRTGEDASFRSSFVWAQYLI